MERGHDQTVVLHEDLAVLLRDLEVRGYELLGGYAPQTDDDLGIDYPDLLHEISDASLLLCGQRIPVHGRTALNYVAYKDVFSPDAAGGKEIVKHTAGCAYERLARLVFVFPRSFTHEHDVGVGVAGTENSVDPGLAQRAVYTGAYLFSQFIKCHFFHPRQKYSTAQATLEQGYRKVYNRRADNIFL